ncbi:MAG: tRNA (adenosine(37)-N6)-threonylcarbamoyltransferase complex dimerization subunit type 1 TsaB [Anaerolineales bacterium]
MLLAVDTSTRMLGIALYSGVQVIGQESWITQDHHTIELAKAVAKILDRVRLRVDDLDALGVALGPGSFTGLRIGLAFMKGIAFHQRIPLLGIPTLDVVAASQPVKEAHLAAVLEAGRERYAVGWYQAEEGHWVYRDEMENLTVEELARKITARTQIAGELSQEAREILENLPGAVLTSPVQSLRNPALLALLAWDKWQKGEEDDPSTLSPIYLHRDQPLPD